MTCKRTASLFSAWDAVRYDVTQVVANAAAAGIAAYAGIATAGADSDPYHGASYTAVTAFYGFSAIYHAAQMRNRLKAIPAPR